VKKKIQIKLNILGVPFTSLIKQICSFKSANYPVVYQGEGEMSRQSLNDGFADVFASKPAVKEDYRMLVFVPFLEVILIYPAAFLL
jgi:hypothetical protein